LVKQRQTIAAEFFSVVIIAVLPLIVYTEAVNSSANVEVLRLNKNVAAAHLFSSSDVDEVPIATEGTQLNYIPADNLPAGESYTINLKAGDILRPDDVEPLDQTVQIRVAVVNAGPNLADGDHVDIFAPWNAPGGGQQEVVIGRAITIENVTQSSMSVLVDPSEEFAWIAISASQLQLQVVRSTDVNSGPPIQIPGPVDATAAVQDLCGPPCHVTRPGG
jgi:hypothetical protein